jgi:hypothetical protein
VNHFAFSFDRAAGRLLPLFGIRPRTSGVVIDDNEFLARLGPVRIATPISNILDVQVTGPYSWFKTIGVHLSLADKGLTLGTNRKKGVCVRFRVPIVGVGRRFGLRHPGLTVTVADPEGLAECLDAVRAAPRQ